MNARPKAFTLIELLVVIAVIVLLLAVLLPSLSKAKARAREVSCATMLRGWGQAAHTYANEFEGALPHSGDRTRNPFAFRGIYCPAFPQNEVSYMYVLPPIMGQKSWLDYPNGQKPTGGIYQCPLAQVAADSEYGYAPSYWGYHSFAMNMFLDADRPTVVPPGVAPYPSFLKLSLAKNPADTILFYETTLVPGQGYGQNGYPGTIACLAGLAPNDGPANFGDRHPHARGKLGGNIIFLDGHAEWRDHVWNSEHADPTLPPITDRLWWPY